MSGPEGAKVKGPFPDRDASREAHVPTVLWGWRDRGCGTPEPPQSPAFNVIVVESSSSDALLASLLEHQPQVVVVDSDRFQPGSRTPPDRLRRAAPNAQWILCLRDTSWASVELLLDIGAHAAAAHDAPAAVWAHAISAVLRGELWLPRGAERWLYQKAEAARRRDLRHTRVAGLTAREAEVHELLERGLTNKQIGKQLDISPNTVKKHVASVFEKEGLQSRRQLPLQGDGA